MIQALSPHTPRGSLLFALALVAAASPADGGMGLRQDTQPRTALEVLVLDRDGEPVFGLTERDFVVTRNGANYAVTGVEEQAAGEAPRRFVFVFNRRGADASQLNRALRGLKALIEESLLDSDESLFADLGETLKPAFMETSFPQPPARVVSVRSHPAVRTTSCPAWPPRAGAFTSPAPQGSGSRSIASRPGTNAGTD